MPIDISFNENDFEFLSFSYAVFFMQHVLSFAERHRKLEEKVNKLLFLYNR